MSKLVLYFGFGDGGHFLRSHTHRSSLDPKEDHPGIPWDIGLMDTGLLKNMKVPDQPNGRVYWVHGGRPDFWHAFVWWDRSGDSRPGSNSGFYVCGFPIHYERGAFAFACAEWPEIIGRQLHALELVV